MCVCVRKSWDDDDNDDEKVILGFSGWLDK